MTHPALEARALVSDERYAAYRESLIAKRREYEKELLHGRCDPRRMDQLCGGMIALDFALGEPDVLLKLDPASNP